MPAAAAAAVCVRRSVLHIHTIVEECEVTKLLYAVDMKTKEQKKVNEDAVIWLDYSESGFLSYCNISRCECRCSHLLGSSVITHCIASTKTN